MVSFMGRKEKLRVTKKERKTILSRILIIDDETDLVMLLEDELRAKGHDVLTAYDGQTGIELSKNSLILLYWTL